MTSNEKIANALSLLEEVVVEPSSEPPAMVVMAPYSGSSIVANKGGFVHLAIASLKASSGEEQSFRKQAWATVEDLDWTVDGLKYDPSAHIYLPEKRKKRFTYGRQSLGLLILISSIVCLVVGAVTITRFLLHIH